MNCEIVHFAGGPTLFMGRDLTELSDWLIKWQRKITANRHKAKNMKKEAPVLYVVWWSLKLGIATRDRDFAVMLFRPLNMPSPCSVLVKKETKQLEIQRKEERERKYQCALCHGMLTLCAALDTELDEPLV